VGGEASAALAREMGMRVELVSPTGDGAGLWGALAGRVASARVCFPRSSRAEVPRLAGIELLAPVLYEVCDRAFDPLVRGRVDLAAFASPSAVESVCRRLGAIGLPAASIGPTTSAAIRQLTASAPVVEAAERDFAALAEASARWLGPSR